jgi:hypothetical protein
MPGWIALRFLSDPIIALRHFTKIDEGSSDPIVLARAAYWRGRAFEAAGQLDKMNEQYTRAAHYSTAYYGQLARARMGMSESLCVLYQSQSLIWMMSGAMWSARRRCSMRLANSILF